MRVLTQDEFMMEMEELKDHIENSKLFIHPTDTIYGIGCLATDENAVKHIRDVKNRHESPFSVIAPSKEWIHENCEITPEAKDWIEGKLPGPYTFILKLKNKGCIASNVNFNMESIGVRIPDHWFTAAVAEMGIPIVTTSANKKGERFMTDHENLDPNIAPHVHFFIHEGEKKGRPSTIVDFTHPEPVLQRR